VASIYGWVTILLYCLWLNEHIYYFLTEIWVVLGQDEYKNPYSIYFIIKIMSSAKLNYIVTQNEFLEVFYALNKFEHYVTGYEVFVHTYNSSIKYVMDKPDINGRTLYDYFYCNNLI
jgi:hypothetical protein